MEYNTWNVFRKAALNKFFNIRDNTRWRDVRPFSEWDERTRIIAKLVPENARVIEFGAGAQKLEALLSPTVTYLPSDVFKRGERTIIIDLNVRPLPDISSLRPDVAVLAGVLEYVYDLKTLISWLSSNVETVIVSYECASSSSWTVERFKESLKRLGAGWINTYSERELAELFDSADFCLKQVENWWMQGQVEKIFVFSKKRG